MNWLLCVTLALDCGRSDDRRHARRRFTLAGFLRGPAAKATSRKRGLPAEWCDTEENEERRVEDADPRPRLVDAVINRP